MGDNLEFLKIKFKIANHPPLLTCDMKIGRYFFIYANMISIYL